jgi:putative addiction module CopG family antidote
MTIHLPEDLERFIQAQVQRGFFASEEEFVTQALRRLQREGEQAAVDAEPQTPPVVPAWKTVLDIMGKIPGSVLDHVPSDGSAQLDHYLYGTPRQSNP